MTRRRTDNSHRGDARGLARRRSNPDAARPQAENRTGTPSGSAPSSPRTANQSVVPDHVGGRPPDEGADARRPRGDRLVDVLLAWMPPDHPLDPDLNRFQVLGLG